MNSESSISSFEHEVVRVDVRESQTVTPDEQRLRQLIDTERKLTQVIASGMLSASVFDDICIAYQKLVPGAICTILRQKKSKLYVLAAPSVPLGLAEQLNGIPIGHGSCGQAIIRGEAIYVSDTRVDDSCKPLREVLSEYNVISCWSIPIRDEHSNPVGTFAINQQKPSVPTEIDRRILETAGHVVSLAFIRQQAEEHARVSESHFQLLAEALDQGLLMTDLDFSILYLNQRLKEMTGFCEADFAGVFPSKVLFPPEERKRMADVLDRRERGETVHYEIMIRRKDGSTFWAEIRGTNHYDNEGVRAGALATITDITERKLIEQTLQLTQFAVDSASESMFTTDENGYIKMVNQTTCDRLGYSRNELLSMHLTDLVLGFDRSQWREHWRKLKHERKLVVEAKHISRSGTVIPVEVSVALFEMNGVSYRCSFARDITERKRSERELLESQRHLQAIADHLPGVAYSYDKHGDSPREAVFIGPGFDELIGPTNAQRVQDSFDYLFELLHPEDRDSLAVDAAAAVQKGASLSRLLRFRTDTGQYKWVSVTGRPTALDDGGVRWHVVALDVDRETRAEQVLVSLAEDTSGVTGRNFFSSLVEHLAKTLDVRHVIIGERLQDSQCLHTLAFWRDGRLVDNIEFDISAAPFQNLTNGESVSVISNVQECNADHRLLRSLRANGFCGFPLRDVEGVVIGQLLLIHNGPIDAELHRLPALHVSAARASAELQRHRVEVELHRSETNLRMMVEQMPAVLWTVDRHLVMTSSSGAALQAMGILPNQNTGLPLHDILQARSSHPKSLDYHRRALAGESIAYENTIGERVLEAHLEPLRDRNGSIVGVIGVGLDVTERKKTHHRLEIMMRELDHRVRNNLTSLISIAHQTAAATDSVPEFLNSLTGRIESMARTYDVIARSRAAEVQWSALLASLLEPFVEMNSGRIQMNGPDVALPSSVAFPMSMVVNELATNATKHGSLRSQNGRLEIVWTQDIDQTLTIVWRETCPTPITQPTTTGFGTSVIDGLIRYQLHGTIHRQYEPKGFHTTITIPLLSGSPTNETE